MSGNSKVICACNLTVVCAIAILVGSLIVVSASIAQDPTQEEDARKLWDSEFLKKRSPSKPSSTSSSPARKSTGYRRVTPKSPPPEIKTESKPDNKPAENKPDNKPAESKPDNSPAENKLPVEKVEGEMIGVTIWRMRPSKQSDSQDARLLMEEDGGDKVELTLERVEAETTFAAGDRVRLGIESPRDGYLYVIDREHYTDGTMSDPYLIFPTLRHRNGDNSVSAGKIIELPARSAFRLKPQRQDYAGEVLTVLVTKQPLSEVSVGPRMVKLDKALVERWEKEWGVQAERFELIGGAGKPYSKAEKEAGQDGARILTQDDELPQTLYRVISRPGQPLLIAVPLRIGK